MERDKAEFELGKTMVRKLDKGEEEEFFIYFQKEWFPD